MTQLTLPLFAVRHRRIGGTESAIYNLTKGLWEIGSDLKLALSRRDFLSPEFRGWLDKAGIPQESYRSWSSRIQGRLLEESWFALFDRSDHVLYPNYFIPFVKSRASATSVIIHDIQCKTYPQYFPTKRRIWLEWNYERAVRNADHILFISEFEREQAARHLGGEFLDRSHVAYNAVDWSRYDNGTVSAATLAMSRGPFMLSVAHQYPHKNLETLIGAFASLGEKHPDLSLILVGQPAASVQKAADELLSPSTRQRIHFTGFVSDADLGHLYRKMSLFALPSLYEGFGMPAVEALAFGKPVLLADAGALREVTMGMATYLPKQATPGQWSEELDRLLGKPGCDREQIAAIQERYSPRSTAGRVAAALKL